MYNTYIYTSLYMISIYIRRSSEFGRDVPEKVADVEGGAGGAGCAGLGEEVVLQHGGGVQEADFAGLDALGHKGAVAGVVGVVAEEDERLRAVAPLLGQFRQGSVEGHHIGRYVVGQIVAIRRYEFHHLGLIFPIHCGRFWRPAGGLHKIPQSLFPL